MRDDHQDDMSVDTLRTTITDAGRRDSTDQAADPGNAHNGQARQSDNGGTGAGEAGHGLDADEKDAEIRETISDDDNEHRTSHKSSNSSRCENNNVCRRLGRKLKRLVLLALLVVGVVVYYRWGDGQEASLHRVKVEKLEAERAGLLSEAYRYHSMLDVMQEITKIEERRSRLGTHFMAQWDGLQVNMQKGAKALDDGRIQEAHAAYKDAYAQAMWVCGNYGQCLRAERMLASVYESRKKADYVDGGKYASSIYSEAESARKDAEKDFGTGEYGASMIHARKARQLYLQAVRVAFEGVVTKRVDDFLAVWEWNKAYGEVEALPDKYRQLKKELKIKIDKEKAKVEADREREFKKLLERAWESLKKGEVEKSARILETLSELNGKSVGELKMAIDKELSLLKTAIDKELSLLETLESVRQALARGQWEEAVRRADTLLSSQTMTVNEFLRKEAEALRGKAVKDWRDDWMAQAETAKLKGDWKRVWECATEALKLEKGYPKAQDLKKEAEAHLGKRKEFEQLLEKARTAKGKRQWAEALAAAMDALKLDALKLDKEIKEAQEIQKEAEMRIGIEKQLEDARETLKSEKWNETVDICNNILLKDPAQEEAKDLKRKAEEALIPRLRIVAKLDGKSVAAISEKHGKTPFEIRNPAPGDKLEGWLTFQSKDGTQYEGSYSVTMDWEQGVQERVVNLEPWRFSGFVMLAGGVRMQFVNIRHGRFVMGGACDIGGHGLAQPKHDVTLTESFWLGETEVTQAQWRAVMNTGLAEQFKLMREDQTGYVDCGNMTLREYWNIPYDGQDSDFMGAPQDDVPMYYVARWEAQKYCRILTEIEQKAGRLPPGYVFSLPTEAQWEYACRAETIESTYIGNLQIQGVNSSLNLDKVAWYSGNACKGISWSPWNIAHWKARQYSEGAYGAAHPVRQKKANAWGLYDMLGNVLEWCLDGYAALPGTPQINPLCREYEQEYVCRGGSWYSQPKGCMSASRLGKNPNMRLPYLGFRVALVRK